ncbi:hypothetical protein [Streptomyces sp. NPDC001500]
MSRHTAVLLAAACLALAGCSTLSNNPKPAATVTSTPTPAAPPVLSPAEVKAACSAAVAAAAPGWADWNVDPGGWQTDPQTPKACLGLADADDPASGNRAFMDAFIKGLEAADDPRARS